MQVKDMTLEQLKQIIREEYRQMTPGVNSPLLNPDVSILNYNNQSAQIDQNTADISSLDSRVDALENP